MVKIQPYGFLFFQPSSFGLTYQPDAFVPLFNHLAKVTHVRFSDPQCTSNFYKNKLQELLSLLASTVSCGGNILINVGPSKEGTIIPIFQERLKQLGTWLKTNGEAIYSTVPWVHQNDTLAKDNPVWYTAGKGNYSGCVYALVIGWPKNDVLTLGSVSADQGSTKIRLIGFEEDLVYQQIEIGLRIQFPRMSKVLDQCGLGCQWIYALKMEKAKPVNTKKLQEPLVQISTI